jgi:hypothetical protein
MGALVLRRRQGQACDRGETKSALLQSECGVSKASASIEAAINIFRLPSNLHNVASHFIPTILDNKLEVPKAFQPSPAPPSQ